MRQVEKQKENETERKKEKLHMTKRERETERERTPHRQLHTDNPTQTTLQRQPHTDNTTTDLLPELRRYAHGQTVDGLHGVLPLVKGALAWGRGQAELHPRVNLCNTGTPHHTLAYCTRFRRQKNETEKM